MGKRSGRTGAVRTRYAAGMDGKESRSRRGTALRRKALRWMGRVMRWGTFFAAVFFAVVWAGGERTHYQRTFTTEKREVAIYACWGGVMVIHQEVRDSSPWFDAFDRSWHQGKMDARPLEDSRYEGIKARLSERRELELELRLGVGEGLWAQRLPRWITKGSFKPTLVLQLPYWFLTAIFASVSGASFLVSHLRSRRAKSGHCTACNYSLAGLSPTAACPECGAKRIASLSTPPQSV